MIAGLTQLLRRTISFYHQQLLLNFWNLAVNSYWAARDADQDTHAERGLVQFRIRIGALLLSVVLAMAFQSMILVRERHWNENKSGFCYRTHDHSATGVPKLWLVGFGIYSIYLSLYLYNCTNERMEDCRTKADCAMDNLQEGLSSISKKHTPRSSVPSFLVCLLADLLRYLCKAFWFLFKHFLSFFCLGDKRRTPGVLAFIAISVWNTYDIIDLKVSNKSLLKGSEMGWAFGQYLQLCLLGMILFITLDSLKK